jgi:hypothetical protein
MLPRRSLPSGHRPQTRLVTVSDHFISYTQTLPKTAVFTPAKHINGEPKQTPNTC